MVTKYQYRALDEEGREVRGVQDASSEAELYEQLTTRRLSPYSIQAQASKSRFSFGSRKISKKLVTRYLRQMSTLLSAGVGLLDTIGGLAKSAANPILAERSQAIERVLRSGGRLSEALAENMPELPAYVPRLAELGEQTGRLGKALSDAADRLEYEEAMRREVNTALSYPIFLASVGTIIILGMFLFVVPRFDALLGEDRTNVPAFSAFIINVGVWLRANMVLFVAAVAAIVVTFFYVLRRHGAALARAVDSLPLVGALRRQSDIGGWARTVGTALANGASLLSALDLGERAVKSQDFATGLKEVRREMRAGKRLDEAMRMAVRIDPLVLDLIRTGANAGSLDEMLLFIAEMTEQDAKDRAQRLSALAEPAAILVIATVVGSIVLGIVLAMTSVYEFGV